MLRARSQTTPIRSKSPAAPHSSPPQMLFLLAGNAREFLARANLCPCRSLQESARSYRLAPRGPRFQRPAASPPCARSSAQIVLRLSAGAAARHSLSLAKPTSKDSPHADATLRAQILLPDNPRHQAAAPPPQFLLCPMPKR